MVQPYQPDRTRSNMGPLIQMNRKLLSLFGVISLVYFTCFSSLRYLHAETVFLDRHEHSSQLHGTKVQFLARDLESGIDYVLADSDLTTRHSPFSTFKIPNMLIALETGVSTSPDHWRDWDPVKRPAEEFWPDVWKQGQTLEQAFARSAVWYFRDLALDIGTEAYRDYLTSWAYGNSEVPEGSDHFWLGDTLKISTREQVDFLEKLVSGELGVSRANLDSLERASFQGSQASISLHGKTGTGPDQGGAWEGRFSGWYVGYLRRTEKRPVVFALHVSAPSFSALRSFRKAFSLTLLQDAGLITSVQFEP